NKMAVVGSVLRAEGKAMSAEATVLKKQGWKGFGPGGGGAAGAWVRVQKHDEMAVFAAKVLRNTSGRPEPRQRFIQEIEALKKLDHPAIIRVGDCECDDELNEFFYVMEYVDGLRPLQHFVGSARTEPNPFYKNAELS